MCDLADPDHLFITLSTGQAGDPESPHFADQLPSWRAGKLFRLTLDAARGLLDSVARALYTEVGEKIEPYNIAPLASGGLLLEWKGNNLLLNVEVRPHGIRRKAYVHS